MIPLLGRRLLATIPTLFGVLVVAFLLLNVVTHGQWWLNIITANVNDYLLSQFKGLLG